MVVLVGDLVKQNVLVSCLVKQNGRVVVRDVFVSTKGLAPFAARKDILQNGRRIKLLFFNLVILIIKDRR